MSPVSVAGVFAALTKALGGESGSELLQPGDGRQVRRLLLAVDPPEDLDDADLVVIHRARGAVIAPHIAVIGCHEPFDMAFGLDATRTSASLNLTDHVQLAPRLALATGDPAAIRQAFGGSERELRAPAGPQRLALSRAMRPDLIELAAGAGATVYVTGAWREDAAQSVTATGIGVLALCYLRSERWALARLRDRLQAELPDVTIGVAPTDVAGSTQPASSTRRSFAPRRRRARQ